MEKIKYSYCEPVTASSYSKWHIRKLTEKGKSLVGGADTLALCGRHVSWDLHCEIDDPQLREWVCSKCAEEYIKLI